MTDFGLSRQSAHLESRVGTEVYTAPELYFQSPGRRYTPLVDVWSLGVVMLECRDTQRFQDWLRNYWNLPVETRNSYSWMEQLVANETDRLNAGLHPDIWEHELEIRELVIFAMKYMVKIDHRRRKDAARCLRRAMNYFYPSLQQQDSDDDDDDNGGPGGGDGGDGGNDGFPSLSLAQSPDTMVALYDCEKPQSSGDADSVRY